MHTCAHSSNSNVSFRRTNRCYVHLISPTIHRNWQNSAKYTYRNTRIYCRTSNGIIIYQIYNQNDKHLSQYYSFIINKDKLKLINLSYFYYKRYDRKSILSIKIRINRAITPRIRKRIHTVFKFH